MKYLLLLGGALLSVGTAQAQTVLPSGAVAPTGTVTPAGTTIAPGVVPGAQPLATPDMRDGGRPRGRSRDQKVPGMSRQDRRQMRKITKIKPGAE